MRKHEVKTTNEKATMMNNVLEQEITSFIKAQN